jgi:Zn ribbon nucleic-acid-binding protein
MTQPDLCPQCKQQTMPGIEKDSAVSARACQNCGYVEELNK